MQTESIERREELLHEIELANEMAVKEAQMKEREKAQRTEELAQQVSSLLPTTFFIQSLGLYPLQVLEQKRQAVKDMEVEALDLDRLKWVELAGSEM